MSTLFENPHQHPLQIPVFQSIENAFSKTVMVCGMKSCRLRALSCQVTQKLKRATTLE